MQRLDDLDKIYFTEIPLLGDFFCLYGVIYSKI
jgi:hypothetical protein